MALYAAAVAGGQEPGRGGDQHRPGDQVDARPHLGRRASVNLGGKTRPCRVANQCPIHPTKRKSFMSLPSTGDTFPPIPLNTVDARTQSIPDVLAGSYGVVLGFVRYVSEHA